jgi:hypothetical protein
MILIIAFAVAVPLILVAVGLSFDGEPGKQPKQAGPKQSEPLTADEYMRAWEERRVEEARLSDKQPKQSASTKEKIPPEIKKVFERQLGIVGGKQSGGLKQVWRDTKNMGASIEAINQARQACWAAMWPFLNKIKLDLHPGAAAYMEYFFLLLCSQYFSVQIFSSKIWEIPEQQFTGWLSSESKKIGRQNFKQINTDHDLGTIDLIGEVVEDICCEIVPNEFSPLNSIDTAVGNHAKDLAMLIIKSTYNSPRCAIEEWEIILRNAVSAGVSIINLAVAKLNGQKTS